MNQKPFFHLLLLWLLVSCASPSTLQTPIPPTLTLPTLIAEEPQPSPTAVLPNPTLPSFHSLRFTTDPAIPPQLYFPLGTAQVFAVWNYDNIPAQATVRRAWQLNGQPWLDREETWTGEQSGTITDVSVYDFTGGGLQPGKYEVQLYIDGMLLVNGRFWVNSSRDPLAVPAPTGRSVAQRLGDRSLVLADSPDLLIELTLTDQPISEIVWLPSGRQIVLVTEDRSEQIGGSTLGIRHALWLVDVATGQTSPLGFYDEDLHEVRVSENGRFLSLISGSSYGDACMVDRTLLIMTLDEQGQRLTLQQATQFAGFPQEAAGSMYQLYPADNGRWASNDQFEIGIAVTCLLEKDSPTLPGLYRLTPTTLQAERIGPLPPSP